MSQGVRLRVEGPYALFTRPEMKVERVSYDVLTPSAARGILEAIHWKPAIQWVVDAIHVLKPIRFTSIRRNELGDKLKISAINAAQQGGPLPQCLVEDDRQQRAALVLRDVAYIIEAHFIMTDKAGLQDSPAKHLDIFKRRAQRGQCFQQPYLGCREFAASFALLPHEEPLPVSELCGTADLGWMLYDLDFSQGPTPLFYRPQMVNGVIQVAKERAGVS